jgi:hypothetical protein
MKKVIYLLFLIMLANVALGCSMEPHNYEECVAEKIKTVSSEIAAKVISTACKKLFPEKKYETFEQCVNEKQNEKTMLQMEEDRTNEIFKTSVYINPESDCREFFPTEETKEYYRCLLTNMRGISTDTAARVIRGNCLKKYPQH